MDHRIRRPNWRTTLIAMILICFGILGCIGTTYFVIDNTCYITIEEWLPLYPDSEVVDVAYTHFRARAMGASWMILETDDDPDTVRGWYSLYRRELSRERTTRGIAQTTIGVTLQDDGSGSSIQLVTYCAYN